MIMIAKRVDLKPTDVHSLYSTYKSLQPMLNVKVAAYHRTV